MNTRPTLKDVGAAAGVSVYVASRALRGESGVAASTRARVERAASEVTCVMKWLPVCVRRTATPLAFLLQAAETSTTPCLLR